MGLHFEGACHQVKNDPTQQCKHARHAMKRAGFQNNCRRRWHAFLQNDFELLRNTTTSSRSALLAQLRPFKRLNFSLRNGDQPLLVAVGHIGERNTDQEYAECITCRGVILGARKRCEVLLLGRDVGTIGSGRLAHPVATRRTDNTITQ